MPAGTKLSSGYQPLVLTTMYNVFLYENMTSNVVPSID